MTRQCCFRLAARTRGVARGELLGPDCRSQAVGQMLASWTVRASLSRAEYGSRGKELSSVPPANHFLQPGPDLVGCLPKAPLRQLGRHDRTPPPVDHSGALVQLASLGSKQDLLAGRFKTDERPNCWFHHLRASPGLSLRLQTCDELIEK